MNKKLTILEIRQDAELMRLQKLWHDTEEEIYGEQYHARITQLFKENNIKLMDFKHGVGLYESSTSYHSAHLTKGEHEN